MLALADRWLGRYTRALDMLSGLCLAIMVVLVFGNVVLRYTANSGITVSEELSRWLFVWLTFMGAVVALREHGHLGTDVLVSRLPAAAKTHLLLIRPQEVSTCRVFNLGITEEAFYALR